MKQLAVKVVEGHIPGGGFHFMMLPMVMENDFQAEAFRLMGYDIIEVDDDRALELVKGASAALRHQVEVALFVERQHPGKYRS